MNKMGAWQIPLSAYYHLILLASVCIVVCADNELRVMRSLHAAYPDWKPRGIVDVGANVGGWMTAMQRIYPGVKTFMVEASPAHTTELEATKQKFGSDIVDYQITVLSSTDGDTVNFYSKEEYRGTGNSIFAEQSKHYKDVKPEQRTTSKLDTLVSNMEHVDYLKLDVQGGELAVLSGAEETLKKTTFVQFEVSVIEYNKGGACWHEIDEFLRQHGFRFYDSNDYNKHEAAFHTKAIGQFDVLYIKPSSDFMPKWLVDNNVVFCGSSREETSSKTTMMAMGTNIFDKDMKLLALLGVTFLAGFFIGKNKTKNIGKKL